MSATGEAQLQAENSAGPAMRATIAQASALLQQGNLADAERLCRDILRQQPNHFEALQLLGAIAVQTRHLEQAAGLFRQAIDANAASDTAHNNLGHTLLELKRPAEALPVIDRAIALAPGIAVAHFNRGIALEMLKRPVDALASYDRAVELRPDYGVALCNRGNVLQSLKRYEEALASYDRSIQFRPDYPLVHYNRGNVLQELNRYADAVASYERACALGPGFALAFSNRGNALLRLRRYKEALASFDRALELQPDYADAHSNRGALLQEMRRFGEALASYDRALAIMPGHSGALSNRGLCLHQLGRYDEALTAFEAANAVVPDNPEAHFGEAQTRLLLGDFARGWEQYEWRSRGQFMQHEIRKFAEPRWREGDAIAGKTVLLYGEQGFGDTIQFCRYVPLVAARGARVILEVAEPLKSLMAGLAGAAQVVAKGEPLPEFDMQCALLSMPLMFHTDLASIPASVPYLHAPAVGVRDWQARLAPHRRPRIGLAWSGRPAHPEDLVRSIGLSSLLPLLECDATFVSLQKVVRPDDARILAERSELLNYADALADFSDTAALIANLDLVISVDTSVVHLAGAMAKPVWVLLAANPDWRWMLKRTDSPWYPTARLFRQDETRAWDGVIAGVQAALREFIKTRS